MVNGAVKLNDSIIAAQKEEATNSAATDLAEASALGQLRSLYKAGKISGKDYVAQARAYIVATNESKEAGLTALVIDDWVAGLKFTQNSLVSLAGSGVTKGKYAAKACSRCFGRLRQGYGDSGHVGWESMEWNQCQCEMRWG